MLLFCSNTIPIYCTVTFAGYQHYEFSVVKELTETSMKLAEETGQIATEEEDGKKSTAEKDQ
jgi:hypothetical protein